MCAEKKLSIKSKYSERTIYLNKLMSSTGLQTFFEVNE